MDAACHGESGLCYVSSGTSITVLDFGRSRSCRFAGKQPNKVGSAQVARLAHEAGASAFEPDAKKNQRGTVLNIPGLKPGPCYQFQVWKPALVV